VTVSLKDDFESAVGRSKALPEKPSNEDLLALYSLYKQATAGDVAGSRPGAFDFVARAKFDAWSGRRGMTSEDAMREYVELVARLEGR
jgi:acyl-CoA-binding protein